MRRTMLNFSCPSVRPFLRLRGAEWAAGALRNFGGAREVRPLRNARGVALVQPAARDARVQLDLVATGLGPGVSRPRRGRRRGGGGRGGGPARRVASAAGLWLARSLSAGVLLDGSLSSRSISA